MRKLSLILSTAALVCVVAFVAGELLVRFTRPVRTMYPRYKFIPEYGFGLYPDRRMVHSQPGHFEFHYTVNEYGYRGAAIPPADEYATRNIVVLGDSFSFGQGVEDDQPYAAVLDSLLGADYQVINLGTPGWGLTQEIRRYYELGERYQPAVVILQYCWNDPEDDLNHPVTYVEDGEFRFRNSTGSTGWAKKFLSGSIIQKSQLYNFYRGRVYEWFQNRHVRDVARQLEQPDTAASPAGDRVSPQESYYCQLFDLFVDKLNQDGKRLIVISVEKQLLNFPRIGERILADDEAGKLRYVDLDRVFEGIDRGGGFYSPEGHWGPKAHRLIAAALAGAIIDDS
jgi:hypothetical protein